MVQSRFMRPARPSDGISGLGVICLTISGSTTSPSKLVVPLLRKRVEKGLRAVNKSPGHYL